MHIAYGFKNILEQLLGSILPDEALLDRSLKSQRELVSHHVDRIVSLKGSSESENVLVLQRPPYLELFLHDNLNYSINYLPDDLVMPFLMFFLPIFRETFEGIDLPVDQIDSRYDSSGESPTQSSNCLECLIKAFLDYKL